ncbi:hypothetical protein L6164_014301 [Bauhinia variegata]|uniref:Uncharacterized protein n=1 Tax=Bauhinia variegata TaxID=167791 RepID=A0ACB9NIV0_BAUVA|nr:hypothetical protein L6164_014301 [Bauhinia variegata]
MVAAYSDASGRPLEVSGNGCSGDMKQNDHDSNAAGINGISNFGIDHLWSPASTKNNVNNLLENVVKLDTSHEQDDKGVSYKEKKEHREEKIQIMKKAGESDEKCEQSLMKETSLKYGNYTADGFSKSGEKHKTLTRKVAPAEKLWDGFLQLNPSVTVSAVAFFKSGEKMPDIKWSDSVEVKGKVKLEDFQKYVQDLRRSRNRRLMVVSLRWKEGSSKSGLTGIKKVANGYKEGHRVGFAQLSPGIDLYVCPRSDTIITILAKHGFFKGKTAIEDNKDSLIGCVVWRRNQTKLKSGEDKSEKRKGQVSISNVSPSGLPPESNLEPSGARRNDAAPNLGLQNLSTSYDSLAAQCTESISPSVPVGPKTSYSDSANQQVSVRQLSKFDSPLMGKSGEVQQELNLKLERAVWDLPSEVSKHSSPILGGEDDLPEFDFGTSCGVVSQDVNNKVLNSLTMDKNLLDKRFRNMDSLLPPVVPNLKSWPSSFQGRLENLGRPGLAAADDTPYMPPQKKVCNRNSISMLPFVVSRQRDTKMSYAASVALPTRNHFDDDDDMPEWSPPDINLEKQSRKVTNQSSNILIHSKEPNSIHPLMSAATQNSFPFSSSIPAERPQVSIQRAHFTFHRQQAWPITANSCMLKGPASYRESNCNSSFRPESCLNNGKMQINRWVRKDWMS